MEMSLNILYMLFQADYVYVSRSLKKGATVFCIPNFIGDGKYQLCSKFECPSKYANPIFDAIYNGIYVKWQLFHNNCLSKVTLTILPSIRCKYPFRFPQAKNFLQISQLQTRIVFIICCPSVQSSAPKFHYAIFKWQIYVSRPIDLTDGILDFWAIGEAICTFPSFVPRMRSDYYYILLHSGENSTLLWTMSHRPQQQH